MSYCNQIPNNPHWGYGDHSIRQSKSACDGYGWTGKPILGFAQYMQPAPAPKAKAKAPRKRTPKTRP